MEKRVELEVRAKSPYRLEISIDTNGLTSIGEDFSDKLKDMLNDYVNTRLRSKNSKEAEVQGMIRELAELCLAGIDECVEAGALMSDEDQAIVCETKRKLYGSKTPITEADALADLEDRPRPDNPSKEATKKQNFEAEASGREYEYWHEEARRLVEEAFKRKFDEFVWGGGTALIACPGCKRLTCDLDCLKTSNQ